MIRMSVNGREARCETAGPLTAGSVGLPVEFGFSSEWDGLSAIAVFRGSGAQADAALLSPRCAVPAEVLAEPGGSLWIGVCGQSGDGATVIPTIWARAGRIEEGTAPSGFDPAEPSPSWAAQVQAAAQAAQQETAALAAALASFLPEQRLAFTAPTALALQDNSAYELTEVSALALSYPAAGHWQCHISLATAASGTVTVTLPASRYIGAVPVFDNGETWEISIRDGVVIAAQAEAPA